MADKTEWQEGKWVLNLEDTKREQVCNLLIEEYKEVNLDWRMRDKYVEDKFIGSIFVFSLISTLVAFVITASDGPRGGVFFADFSYYLVGSVFFGVLFFFGLVMLISLVKDTYYRNGSERMSRLLLNVLEVELGSDCISVLRREAEDPEARDDIPARHGPFTRKIKAPVEGKAKLGIPLAVEKLLSRRMTFRWITAFYALVTMGCLAISLSCLVLWILGS